MKTSGAHKITIRDVAERTHTSISSVSRVVHNYPGIDPGLRSRIEQAIQDLNYCPAPRKSRLRGYRVIYYLLTNRNLRTPFHAKVLQAVEDECTRRGDLLLFRTFRYAPEMPSQQLEAPLKDRAFSNNGGPVADGMIISGLISTNFLRALERTNIPFVVSGSTYSGADPAADLVSVDLQQGGYDATRYLIDLGHKSILFIGDISIKWFNDIYNGYLIALRESNLRPFGQTKTLSDNFYSNGYLNVEMAFEQSNRITAVFAAYDEMALGALQALTNLGLNVPRQVSLIGFDEEDYAAFTVPPLTTVKVDADALGREIVSQLYKKFANPSAKATSVKLPTVLMKRGSCRPPSTT